MKPEYSYASEARYAQNETKKPDDQAGLADSGLARSTERRSQTRTAPAPGVYRVAPASGRIIAAAAAVSRECCPPEERAARLAIARTTNGSTSGNPARSTPVTQTSRRRPRPRRRTEGGSRVEAAAPARGAAPPVAHVARQAGLVRRRSSWPRGRRGAGSRGRSARRRPPSLDLARDGPEHRRRATARHRS